MIVDRLRRLCRHDSRSVEDCPNCEAADEIESLQRANAELLKRNVVLSSTPEPPAPASKEQFTDLLLELEHAAEVYGQSGGQSALHSVREARAAVLAAWPTPEPPAVPVAYMHEITEPEPMAGGSHHVMYSASANNPWSHWVQQHREKCEYRCTPLYTRAPQPPSVSQAQIDETCKELGELMADFADRDRIISADTCGTAIALIRAAYSAPTKSGDAT